MRISSNKLFIRLVINIFFPRWCSTQIWSHRLLQLRWNPNSMQSLNDMVCWRGVERRHSGLLHLNAADRRGSTFSPSFQHTYPSGSWRLLFTILGRRIICREWWLETTLVAKSFDEEFLLENFEWIYQCPLYFSYKIYKSFGRNLKNCVCCWIQVIWIHN